MYNGLTGERPYEEVPKDEVAGRYELCEFPDAADSTLWRHD
jgi:hypothetical protein